MALIESSIFWATSGVGDGTATGYTQAQVFKHNRMIYLYDMATDGVAPGYLNELAVTDVGSRNLQINTGGAIVAGASYFNDGAGNLTLTHPTVGTTGWRIVLRMTWATQLVRLVLLQNTDGNPAVPAVTQNDGVTWEISIAYGTITTGDVVTVTNNTDNRLQPNFELRLTHFLSNFFTADATGRAKFADGIWTTAKLLDGVLSADATGRAKMADSFLTLAKILDGIFTADAAGRAKFADGIWSTSKLADGVLSADATGRAKMADAFLTQAKLGTDTLQIAIIPVQSTHTTSSASYEDAKSRATFDKNRFPAGTTAKLHVVMYVGDGTGYARLYNVTTGAAVTGSELSTVNTTPTECISADILANLAAGDNQYRLEVKYTPGTSSVAIVSAWLQIEW